MILISNKKDYYNHINRESKKNNSFFYIATYGFKLEDDIKEILNNLKKSKCKDIKILIGLNNPSKKQTLFLKTYLKEFNVKLFNNSHLKMIVNDSSSIIGGRNLTQSDWKDTGVKFVNKQNILKLKSEFLKNYNSKSGLL
jgi:hypothetical protein